MQACPPPGVQPAFDDCDIDRKTDPERDSEELVRAEMRTSAGCKENSHHGPGGSDTQKNTDGASCPLPLSLSISVEAKVVGPPQREQKPGVEDKDRRALDPAADCEGAHRIRGQAGNEAERKEEPFDPFVHGGAKQHERSEDHENGRW